jgi:hypothetical protein
MSADEERGRKLAELARLLRLWLMDNELEHLPGIERKSPNFLFYAGVYRQLNLHQGPRRLVDNRRLPNLYTGQPDELQRFFELNLGITHLLLIDNPHETVDLPNGIRAGVNAIVASGKPLTQPGAYMTVKPRLDSMVADGATLATTRNYDFAALLPRVDLVWDDAAASKAVSFQYPEIFGYKAPRTAYAVNVRNLPVPAELAPTGGNAQTALLAKRVRAYREHVYRVGTYKNRTKVAEDAGGYFRKWRAEHPVAERQRQFRPTLLTDKYLKESFHEFVMPRGDDLLMIDLPGGRYFYRLLMEAPRPNQATPRRFTVEFILKIGDYGPLRPLAGKPSDDDAFDDVYPDTITAVVFHALDGADHLPSDLRYGNLDYTGGLPVSFVVDYKALLRRYYADPKLKLGDDPAWFDRFVEVFFADEVYPIQLDVHPAGVSRDEFFLDMMTRAASSERSAPIKNRLDQLVDWAKGHPWRYFFIQGTNFGTKERPRELIGLYGGDVYEWHPVTALVTRTAVGNWLLQVRLEGLAADVYRSTAGALTWIKVVTWGGVVVMTGGLLIAPGGISTVAGSSLSVLARTTVIQMAREGASRVASRVISYEAARTAGPYLIAMVVDAAMTAIPNPGSGWRDSLWYEFFHGFFHGFSSGAVQHYLTDIDDRLEAQIKKIPAYALNWATKGGYRAYVIYDKVSAALIRMTGVVRALTVVLVDDRARLVVVELGKFSRHVGYAFMVILFVVIYFDWVNRSRPGIAADKWVRAQGKTLQWMVTNTGTEIADYARDLKKDLLSLGRDDPHDPDVRAAVRKHDDQLSGVVGNVLHEGVAAVPAVAEYLEAILSNIGIKNWQELEDLGFTEILARGLDALPLRGLAKDQSYKAGAAFGELLGTLLLERQIVPKVSKEKSKTFFPMGRHDAIKGSLANGTWRDVWRAAIFPIRDLGSVPASLKRGLDDQIARTPGRFTPPKSRDSAYREFFRSLVVDEEELTRRLANLAKDAGLERGLRTIVANAAAGHIPPSLKELTESENPEWPADAILFLLYTWLRMGLHRALLGFKLIEDSEAFAGQFRVADLLDILGLDIALDDATVAALKTQFTKAAASL